MKDPWLRAFIIGGIIGVVLAALIVYL